MANSQRQNRLLRWQETIWLLIAFLTPLWVNLWVEQQFEASKVWLLRTLVFVLVALWLGGWHLRKNRLPQKVLLLTVTLTCVIILSTIFSQYRHIALHGSLERAAGMMTQLCYLGLFLAVGSQIEAESRERLLRVMVWTGIPIGLFGLAQMAGWQPLTLSTDARTGLATTLGRSNFTAAYLALLVPLTLATILQTKSQLGRTLYGTLAIMELIVIGATQARAGMLALLTGCAIFGWFHLRRFRALTAIVGLFMFVVVTLFGLQWGIASDGSIAARWTIWGATLPLLWRSPWLGYGADTLELIFPAVYPPQLVYYQGRDVIVDRVHNWLLDFSLSYGIVATGLLIALVGIILWAQRDTQGRWLQACIASVCAQLVGNLFLFEVAATGVVFWLLLAILVGGMGTRITRITRIKNYRLLLGVLVVGAVGLGWWGNVRPILADAASWRGTQALVRGDVETATVAYRQATEWQPRRAAYWVALGLTEMERGEFVSAESHLQSALAIRPSDPILFSHLATLYTRWNRLPEADIAHQQAIALAPNVAIFHQQYADFALRTGDFALAVAAAERAVELDATNGLAYGVLGWARLELGELADAEAAFSEAVEWVESADFYLGLATVYYRQDDLPAAHVAVEKSLTIDPNYEPALTLQLQLKDN